MRMSSYYCDICGEPHLKTELAPRKLLTDNNSIFDYSEVCVTCCGLIDAAPKARLKVTAAKVEDVAVQPAPPVVKPKAK